MPRLPAPVRLCGPLGKGNGSMSRLPHGVGGRQYPVLGQRESHGYYSDRPLQIPVRTIKLSRNPRRPPSRDGCTSVWVGRGIDRWYAHVDRNGTSGTIYIIHGALIIIINKSPQLLELEKIVSAVTHSKYDRGTLYRVRGKPHPLSCFEDVRRK